MAAADATRGAVGRPGGQPSSACLTASSGGTAARPGNAAPAARAWLWITVVLTAGSFTAAVVLAPPSSASPGHALSWLLFTGSSVHVAATGWLFTLPEVRAHARRHRGRYLWAPGCLVLATAAAAFLTPAALGWLLLPFLCWQFFHYQKQNLGLAALAASSARLAPLRPGERRALLWSGAASIAALLARPGLLQLRLHTGLGAVFPVAAAAFAVAVAAGLAALARRPAADRPAGFCLIYLMSLLFGLPVFVFGSPYAAVGGMTAAHGLQYLLLVGLLAGGSTAGRGTAGSCRTGSSSRGSSSTVRLARLALLANIALAGGAALSAASHLHNASLPGRLIFGAYLGAVMSHFVADAGLWRLREEFPRQFVAAHLPYLLPARPSGASTPASPVIPEPDRSAADIGSRS